MVKIEMPYLLGETLCAAGTKQPSLLHSGINIQAEIKLRIYIGENSLLEVGQDEKICAVHLEGDVLYGGEGDGQVPVDGFSSCTPCAKEGK